jgi:hypothetical protein
VPRPRRQVQRTPQGRPAACCGGGEAIVPLTLLAGAAQAEPLPLPKPPGPGGSCPHSWLATGSHCVPSQGAQDAVPKPPNGTCPWGMDGER